MKASKNPATGPSTDGSNTTPARQEALVDKPENVQKQDDNVSEGHNSDDNNED